MMRTAGMMSLGQPTMVRDFFRDSQMNGAMNQQKKDQLLVKLSADGVKFTSISLTITNLFTILNIYIFLNIENSSNQTGVYRFFSTFFEPRLG